MNKLFFPVAALLLSITACNDHKENTAGTEQIKKDSMVKGNSIKTEDVNYTGDGVTMKGFVAYNETMNKQLPVVLIVHEWWGISDYTRNRAKQLADMGYLAFAIDMYGEGKTAETPEEAGKLAAPFYSGVKVSQPRFEAALAKIKTYPNADTNHIAAIGYCFGGSMVLNMAKIGEPLKAVVSFHGNLAGVPVSDKGLKAAVLVCHGEADQFVKPEEVAAFKKEMEAAKADFTFRSYPGATHAFTNPAATEKGKKFSMPIAYNEAADTASFNEMKKLFERVMK